MHAPGEVLWREQLIIVDSYAEHQKIFNWLAQPELQMSTQVVVSAKSVASSIS